MEEFDQIEIKLEEISNLIDVLSKKNSNYTTKVNAKEIKKLVEKMKDSLIDFKKTL